MSIPVCFTYHTGLKRGIFRNARLIGSWDDAGRYAEQWISVPMRSEIDEECCPRFTTTVEFDENNLGWEFRWGVMVDGPAGNDMWGIMTEVNDRNSASRYRTFVLKPGDHAGQQQEHYYLTNIKRLGANKCNSSDQSVPGIRFAVWAPNASNVEVVFGGSSGYIANDGFGEDPAFSPIPMTRLENGIWQTGALPDFPRFDHQPYMYRIINENGRTVYRTDLYSRCQIGKGAYDPKGDHFQGRYTELDGTKSCSVIIDPDTIAANFNEDTWPEHTFIPESEFWRDEFSPANPLPERVEDLVIYELHVGSLGFGENRPGNFSDAIKFLDYLRDLGINAIELLPVSEFRGSNDWGYSTSHYFALEFSAGGRDQFKHFIRECHRHGMVVIMDVVYNHYHHDAERAQWQYDSEIPEHNIYYWYEGRASDYPYASPPELGGYLDNESTGYAPRYYEEMVRNMFISSAVTLVENFHIDGFRVDQTTSMHIYNKLHANNKIAVPDANNFGAKFLRELTRTLKIVRPGVILMAEDHSGKPMVTENPDTGGLGFDATWYSNFYHHLIGDTRRGREWAKLITEAGCGHESALAMDYFAGALNWSGHKNVVYHESHDEAGNSPFSHRTMLTAVNSAPLWGETRRFAEARCRFAFGMSMLSAGTPMFLMGEEIGACKDYQYNNFIQNRENLISERQGEGRRLYKFYQDLINLRLIHSGLRSHNIEIVCVHNANRLIALRRWNTSQEFLIVASLNNQAFSSGYLLDHTSISDGFWQEIFNSDSEVYGGNNIGNLGADIIASLGQIIVVVPANGFLVLEKK